MKTLLSARTCAAALALTLLNACATVQLDAPAPVLASAAAAPEGPAYVSGEIEAPNRVETGDLTVFEAVNGARPSADADLSRVVLIRVAGREAMTIKVDVAHMAKTGDSSQNVLLHAGDVVYVPERTE